MPFKSQRQRRYMHAVHPAIAKRWEAEAKRKHKPKSRITKRPKE